VGYLRQSALAKERGLEHLENEKSYRLPFAKRVERICALFEGLAHLEGGAKQALHYTDVAPALVFLAVTKGGNHIFGHTIGATGRGLPDLKMEAFKEALTVFEDQVLSDVYVGWVKGYLDNERAEFEAALGEEGELASLTERVRVSHPREAFQALVSDLQKPENAHWLARATLEG
jgi:CRISPR-associated protein Cst2